MDQLRLWDEEPEPVRRTLGQKVCIALSLIVLAVGLVGLALSCCPARRRVPEVPDLPLVPRPIEEPATVRVLLRTAPTLTAAVSTRGTWRDAEGRATLAAPPGGGPWTVGTQGGSLTLDGRPLGVPAAELQPARGYVRLEGRDYRGSLLMRADDGAVRAVNVVPPEDYLRSVVAAEMYVNWPMEALMAQAVAARTYMLYTVLREKGYLTTIDMAYGGRSVETGATDLAVKLTEDVALTYAGDLFSAYFHSTCGGHTISVDRVFDYEPIPPLRGVPCGWCEPSPAYEWKANFTPEEIRRALGGDGPQSIREVAVVGAEAHDYADSVLINQQVEVDAYRLRLALGGGKVKSTWFRVERVGDEFVFSGRGYGHGVGLCQWGAWGMAGDGYSWQQILRHYYPGAAIERIGGE